jgi:hypothetical protein
MRMRVIGLTSTTIGAVGASRTSAPRNPEQLNAQYRATQERSPHFLRIPVTSNPSAIRCNCAGIAAVTRRHLHDKCVEFLSARQHNFFRGNGGAALT